jgi:hypothetical protein
MDRDLDLAVRRANVRAQLEIERNRRDSRSSSPASQLDRRLERIESTLAAIWKRLDVIETAARHVADRADAA